MSPSTNYECALLVDGFESHPQIMMPYNPPYYGELVERAGFRKAKDLLAYWSNPDSVKGEKSERVAARALAAAKMQIRPIRMDRFQAEVEAIWHVYNGAWSRNWGFVPMSRDEFFFMAKDMKNILDPGLVLVGEVGGEPAGFALALPNINEALKHTDGRLFPLGLLKILYHRRSIRSLRVLALGVLERYRTAAIAAGLYVALMQHARRRGYSDCELSWVLEDNLLMNRSMQALGAKPYKTYRIYEWN
jgi:hypothetical protein